MLIALRNIKHDGIEYFADEELPKEVFTQDQLETLIQSGAVKEFKSRNEAKAAQEESAPAASETPAEAPADAPAEDAVPAGGEVIEGTPSVNWSKQKLLDFAAQNNVDGVTPDMTRSELFAKITGQEAGTGDIQAEETANGSEAAPATDAPATTETAPQE